MRTLEKGTANCLNKIKIKFFFLIITIVLLSNVGFALCNEDQIDINSANEEELDNLYGVGPVTAKKIVDVRPFSSVEDLTKVNGIGEKTLEKIKDQDLACVEEEEEKEAEEVKKTKEIEEKTEEVEEIEEIKKETESIINLNPQQSTSSKVIYESKDEKVKNMLLLAFNLFLILVIALLLLKK